MEYAHFLGDIHSKEGIKDVEVYADSYVTLNGRISRQFIDPTVNLYKEKRGFKHKKWQLMKKLKVYSFIFFISLHLFTRKEWFNL